MLASSSSAAPIRVHVLLLLLVLGCLLLLLRSGAAAAQDSSATTAFDMQVLLTDPAFTVVINATVLATLYTGTAGTNTSIYQATNITGVRTYTNVSTGVVTVSTITGLLPIEALDYNFNLLFPFNSIIDGFLDGQGLAFTVSPPAPLAGVAEPVSSLSVLVYGVADEPQYTEAYETSTFQWATEQLAQRSLVAFTPGTSPFFPPPQTFDLYVLLQSEPSFTITINATVTGFLYSGTANSSDSIYQATNMIGVRVVANGTTGVSTSSFITGLLPVDSLDYHSSNLFYPFANLYSGVVDSTGIAFTLSPPALFVGSTTSLVSNLSLFLYETVDEPVYAEASDIETETLAQITLATFTPGTPVVYPPPQTFYMQVLLLDPEFSVSINATVMGFLYSGTANSSDSVYQATNMTGVRVFTNALTGESTVSAITGLLPLPGLQGYSQLFYPFADSRSGFLTGDGLGFTVSPPAPLYSVPVLATNIVVFLQNNADNEPQYAEDFAFDGYGIESVAQTTVLSFTPGTPPLTFPPSQSFHMQAVLEDTTWRVTIDATVEGFLYSGTANTTDSIYQATTITGVRVYTNLSSGAATSSVIAGLLPVYYYESNDNLFYPFTISANGTLDTHGLSLVVSPPATFSSQSPSDLVNLQSSYGGPGTYSENFEPTPLHSSVTFVLSADLTAPSSSSSSSSSSTGPASLSSSSSASLQSSSSSAVSPLSSAAGSASSSSSSSSGSLQPSSSSSSFRVGVIGDPQFVGLLGQSFQVHGVSGFVYSLIIDRGGVSVTGDSGSMSGDSTSADSGSADSTSADRDSTAADRAVLGPTLVNARFIFLSSGRCPPAAAAAAATTAGSNCWSHPGSYLGELGVVSPAGDRLHIVSGAWDVGFHTVTLNGATMDTHRAYNMSTGASAGMDIAVHSPYSVSVTVGAWQLTVDNSDRFVNLVQLRVRRSWAELSTVRPHGLLGQTWQLPTRASIQNRVPAYFGQLGILDLGLWPLEFGFFALKFSIKS